MSDAATATGAPPCAPAVDWASGALGAVQKADREIARQTALRARAVAEFAATRPAAADRQAGQPGAMSEQRRAARPEVLAAVSEWAAQEVVVALSISQQAAEALLERSLSLVHRLPATLDALEAGVLHPGHLWALLEKVAPIAAPEVRARVEAEVLAWVAGRSVTTPTQLGGKVHRSVLRHDASAAAQRLLKAVRERGVWARGDHRDGMSVLAAVLTTPETAALTDALGRYADALVDPGDVRTRGQKMADILLDLVLRPGEHDHAPVQAQLTVVAGVATLLGGDQPGEVGGETVPAEMVRALARALGLLPATGDAAPEVPPAPERSVTDAMALPAVDDLLDEQAATYAESLERWWQQVELRAMRGEWAGADEPPRHEQERWWAQEEAWDALETEELSGSRPLHADLSPDEHPAVAADTVDPPDSHPPDPDPHNSDGAGSLVPSRSRGSWAVADEAVAAASSALLDLDRAHARARRAVADAERADALDDAVWQDSPAGKVSAARTTLDACAAVTDQQRKALGHLLDATAGGGLVDRPRIAVVDELTGALLALTHTTELRRLAGCGSPACRRDLARCDHDLSARPGLGPPPPTDGYRPGTALDRYVRARDRRCRFPGCRRRVPHGGELDHNRPWPDGATSAQNLTGYCTGHHRGKHQAPGWTHDLAPDGTLTVTSPTGLAASTTPPPY